MGFFLTLLLGIAGLLYQQIDQTTRTVERLEDKCEHHNQSPAHAQALVTLKHLKEGQLKHSEWIKENYPSIIGLDGLETALRAQVKMLEQKHETQMDSVKQNYDFVTARLSALDDRLSKYDVFQQQAAWFDKQLTTDRKIKANGGS
jgi:hypothetical protein